MHLRVSHLRHRHAIHSGPAIVLHCEHARSAHRKCERALTPVYATLFAHRVEASAARRVRHTATEEHLPLRTLPKYANSLHTK